ncbi:RNase MRP subunit [Ophidiomyces ophidiicola]|nr:RNase MRP subunit [Ophidiomyces ophidiicola]KAI1982071.1 RNase MRP subunit [Ophidiomyces ophidiicola]
MPKRCSQTAIPPAESFFYIRDKLHLIYHHNKNQHRNIKWFKWLGILKRWTNKLAVDIETTRTRVHFDLMFEDDESESIQSIAAHLARNIVPRCYGLLKMPNLKDDSIDISDVKQAGIYMDVSLDNTATSSPKLQSKNHPHEDLGEVVRRSPGVEVLPSRIVRKEHQAIQESSTAPAAEIDANRSQGKRKFVDSSDANANGQAARDRSPLQADAHTKSKDKRKKKKKRKKGDAIDDIFGAFG